MASSAQLFKNNAKTTLNGTLAIGGTSINLPSGHGNRFPTPSGTDYFLVTLYEKDGAANEITYEIVKCTARVGDVLTVSRDFEGIVVGAGGTSGGWAYPSPVGVNPSQVVYIDLRYTAYGAGNSLGKDGNLTGLTDTPTARTNLGLGTMATQAASAVAITGGTITGVTLTDSTTLFADNVDNTKKMQFELASIGTGLTRTITVPNTDITLPGVNIANTWAAAQTFSSTINKVTVTPPTTSATLTITDGKTLTVSNTLTLSGTDSSTLNIGAGGTLGTAAYTAASAYQAAGTYAGLAGNTFTGAQVISDQQVSRAMLIDCGYTFVDKGNSGTSTQTYDYTAGSHQKSTVTGAHTIATSNWPPTGNLGELLIELVNGGSAAVTMPTVNWIKPDGTTTTTWATYLAANTGRTALQTSGTDFILLWTRDAGTTVWGRLL